MNSRSKHVGDEEMGAGAIDAIAYGEFIKCLELTDIHLAQAELHGPGYRSVPDHIRLAISVEATYTLTEDGFIANQSYRLDGYDNGDNQMLSIEATFALAFRSEQPMTETLFSVFQDVNLPVNSWPYFREFVASSSARMGWEPFTLPTLKRGIPQERASNAPAKSASKRTQSKRTTRRISPDSAT